MSETIKQILMRRDGLKAPEADELIQDAKQQLEEYLADGDISSADEICMEFFSLEADYIYELI